ncbi:hypothetical protein [uncultured Gammaproteobacteria bacterium]|jgi:hypothetical protein|uniref:Uncharacterized protein n=1 Tax=Bathymodiolus thermophilus thioautotrophic gill symbiont TaxID=2360 RepID=A0ABN7GGW3_9GAMM|nr:hypothetical protein AZO1586I_2691 [Bathymodiolus thermophilus thioautotrophic gill symbiont]CAC5815288.1 hypothetical protein [uncultured Gammaproteobacteria bacterium]CAC9505807.1 hypothetical protein [uncultured Gammaproteobacteria bacterium]CAC9509574.1 hypothetical protein [uncultured Gammaproteobacteria bacterium]CAC9517299.1 hypothetical protein [uncultured Gammaproteobacteria bacterium]
MTFEILINKYFVDINTNLELPHTDKKIFSA